MQAKKLKSGSWRCRVYAGTETVRMPDGTLKEKQIRRSFTVADPSQAGKRECERQALEWLNENPGVKNSDDNLTLGDAIDQYIDARSAILSPRTVTAYRAIRKTYLQRLMPKKLSSITQEEIQREINILAENHSPKSVRNIHGLLTAVMHVYRPNFAIRTILPKKVRPDIYVPSDSEIQTLMAYSAGSNMELPILLAAFGPMRRGEICALQSEDIKGNTVHVCRNMVKNQDKTWIIKAPKSYAGDRFIEYPDFVAEKWKGIEGRICDLLPSTVTRKFGELIVEAGLPHFRFHDLRHYAASSQHAIGIPDAYIMQRGGWGHDGTLKEVYRHTMTDRQEEMAKKTNDYYSKLAESSGHESGHEIHSFLSKSSRTHRSKRSHQYSGQCLISDSQFSMLRFGILYFAAKAACVRPVSFLISLIVIFSPFCTFLGAL